MTQGDKIVQCYIPAFTRSILNSIKIVVDDSFNEKFCSSPEESLVTFSLANISKLYAQPSSLTTTFCWGSVVSQSHLILTNSVGSIKQLSIATSTTLLYYTRVEGPVKLLTSRRKQIYQLIVQSTEKSYE